MAGAPVSAELHEKVRAVIAEDGETLVPYGATESLPVATFTGSEMLRETATKTAEGEGYCVGYPLPGITIKVIKAVDRDLGEWHHAEELPAFERGEIVVHGDVVTPAYNNREKQTRAAKIKHSDGTLWHRMGDVGYVDDKGRVWFCGRKGHRVITGKRVYYPVCCEAIFNKHPRVFRTAIVGVGQSKEERKPLLVVEPVKGHMPKNELQKQQFIAELKQLGKKKDFTSEIELFLFHPSFPVDIRHNAKIFREKLTVWAAGKV
jgi:acyl-CoA synthetase (AMP-forming)/AMP-acid ligase II